MGIIWSRFKKKVSTKEVLQKIQEDITSLEEYGEHTEQRRRKLVGSLIAYSIFFFLIAAIVWYFYYLPPTLEERLLYATPFVGFIILIYFIKKLLTCYYRWKVRRNESKLSTLKEKKAEILNQVMETETYKVAKEILEIYAPEQIRKASMTLKSPSLTPANSQRMQPSQGGEVRRRIISPQTSQSFSQRPMHTPARPGVLATPVSYGRHIGTPRPQQIIRPNVSSSSAFQSGPRMRYSSPPMNAIQFARSEGSTMGHAMNNNGGSDAPGPPMPRPILPRERGILDRFVEYLVGDGPSNRYALVCKQCESHNGMALRDEFPYIAFRCAYCYYWNPARKQKPAPPRLENIQQRPAAEVSRRMLEKEEELSSSEEEEETDSDSSSTSNPSSEDADEEGTPESCAKALVGDGEGAKRNICDNLPSERSEDSPSEKQESSQESESNIGENEKLSRKPISEVSFPPASSVKATPTIASDKATPPIASDEQVHSDVTEGKGVESLKDDEGIETSNDNEGSETI